MNIINYAWGVGLVVYADGKLDEYVQLARLKDIKLMKVIHDLKNPIYSIKQIINEHNDDYLNDQFPIDPQMNTISTHIEQHRDAEIIISSEIQRNVNLELEDLEEMLESLRMEFKSNQQMEFNEEVKPINSTELLLSLQNSQARLAETTNNCIKLSVRKGFPKVIHLKKSLFKRIINNFISNSLKHSNNGVVEVELDLMLEIDIMKYYGWEQVGAELGSAENYIRLSVKDNGQGIPIEKLKSIFLEKESDQTAANWDGCGLGLPICQKLAISIGARIFYTSEKEKQTCFMMVIPFEPWDNVKGPIKTASKKPNQSVLKSYDNKVSIMNTNDPELSQTPQLNKYIERLNEEFNLELNYNLSYRKEHEHICNCLYIAEDTKSISKRYESYLKKHDVKYVMFPDGQKCLQYIKKEMDINCQYCSKYLLITDYQMPVINGIQLASEIRAIDTGNKIEIYILSAEDSNTFQSRSDVFDSYFSKPIKISQFKIWYEYLVKYNNYHQYFENCNFSKITTNKAKQSNESRTSNLYCSNDFQNNEIDNVKSNIENLNLFKYQFQRNIEEINSSRSIVRSENRISNKRELKNVNNFKNTKYLSSRLEELDKNAKMKELAQRSSFKLNELEKI